MQISAAASFGCFAVLDGLMSRSCSNGGKKLWQPAASALTFTSALWSSSRVPESAACGCEVVVQTLSFRMGYCRLKATDEPRHMPGHVSATATAEC